ncbi:MAG: pseudaminic acid synthase [Fimbriimonadaceae bacterium]
MTPLNVDGRKIGPGEPVYIIAEISANHNGSLEEALKIVDAAAEAGVDAVKLQTYTPDTMTLDSDKPYFQIGQGTIWEGKNLYQLYQEAYTPWEWQPKILEHAQRAGLQCFSTPFDESSVEFLEDMGVHAYKIASFELTDIPLLKRVAETGKPMIVSTGMGNLAEIEEAVRTIREAGGEQLALLKCTSAYPAPPEAMNLRTMVNLAETFGVAVGLSDHTLGNAGAIASVALGACIIEKHITLDRGVPGPDSAFSLEPHEFKALVRDVREASAALGKVNYEPTEKERASATFRRSLFVAENVEAGDTISEENCRVIRPSHGLHPRFYPDVLGKKFAEKAEKGTPLDWSLVADD